MLEVHKKGISPREKRHRTKIDLALPSVVINKNSIKKQKKKRDRNFYRFLAVLIFCLALLFQVIDRTILRLPPGDIRLDFSNVKKAEDLSVDPIESWCLNEEHDSCSCQNPLIPEGRQEDQRWERVSHLNREKVASKDLDALDVIFLGDSITEGWTGTFYNNPDERVRGAGEIFQSYFSKRHGGQFEGINQGISADVTPNLLWRIQNGEIGPDDEDLKDGRAAPPAVFWVLIGTNDLGNHRCSADIVIVGVIRIVEELLKRRPSSIIVINGLLPRTYDKSGFLMQSQGKQPILWPTIVTINKELQRYAQKRKQVEYFETNVFYKNATAAEMDLRIDKQLMTDYLHPSAEGYRLWGREIVASLESLMKTPQTEEKGV